MTQWPQVQVDPTWCLLLDGFDPDVERAREVVAAIADGRIGLSGAPLVEHDTARRWALGNGVYDGEGSESHLLAGPVGFHLPHALHPEGGLRRAVDLQSGVLTEEARTATGVIRSLRFCSLARPGLAVARILDIDEDAGPVLQPSTEGSAGEGGCVHEAGDDVQWLAAGASTGGGIVAAAVD